MVLVAAVSVGATLAAVAAMAVVRRRMPRRARSSGRSPSWVVMDEEGQSATRGERAAPKIKVACHARRPRLRGAARAAVEPSGVASKTISAEASVIELPGLSEESKAPHVAERGRPVQAERAEPPESTTTRV